MPDISEANLKALIRVLATDPPLDVFPYYEQFTNDEIQDAIRRFPSAHCKKMSIFSPSRTSVPTATLCTTHKRLNPYIISHIFRMIKRETGDHLDLIVDWYPGYPQNLQQDVKEGVQGL
ncbi:uncharacterized protein BDV17DRAFT_248313 [Aspergillus undulatus]|uniref:uncharacterized protein n=1 Tax=Aspergillus undulatus TaxID=1810928 RepID=UPI003CCD71E2